MNSAYLGIGTGVITFIVVIWLSRIISKIQQINPLLGLGGFYIFFYFLTGKLINAVPESWQTKQIDNEFVIAGFLGSFFHLNQPKISIYELAFITFQMCLIGYIIYVFSFKDSLRKTRRNLNKKGQGTKF